VVQHGVAIDLKQVKTFKQNGAKKFTKLYDSTEIIGTEEACKAEMSDVWRRIRGKEGQKMRLAMKRLRKIAETSWKEGQSRETMEGISRYFV
jgi:hypothetical protein